MRSWSKLLVASSCNYALNFELNVSNFVFKHLISPSPDGEATMLGVGLAAVGEEADVTVVTVSIGAIPVWGEESEEEPGEARPTLFCRGDRGLWAEDRKKNNNT